MIRGAIYGATAAAIWGGMYVISDVVLQTIPPFTLLLLRLILGALVIGFLLLRTGIKRPTASMLRHLIGVGIVGYGVSLGAQFIGTDLSTAVNGAIVTSATPAFVIVFAVLILKEQLTVRSVLSVVVASIGVIVILDLSQASFRSDTFVGNLFLGIAAITWGLYSVLIRYVSGKFPQLDTLLITFVTFLGGMLLVVPASVAELSQRSIGTIDGNIILGVLYLGVVSTAGAMWLWNRAFALLDASVASLLFFVQPISGALLGTIFLQQPLTTNIWIGGTLIAIGVLLSIAPRKAATTA
jgi:drug/metabolite transporter (DMT)-like permease